MTPIETLTRALEIAVREIGWARTSNNSNGLRHAHEICCAALAATQAQPMNGPARNDAVTITEQQQRVNELETMKAFYFHGDAPQEQSDAKPMSDQILNAAARHVVSNVIVPPASTHSPGREIASFGKRLRNFAGKLVGEAFVADLHNMDGSGPREVQTLADKFEREILDFMLDEKIRSVPKGTIDKPHHTDRLPRQCGGVAAR